MSDSSNTSTNSGSEPRRLVGDILRDERILRDEDLKDVAKALAIRLPFMEAIEDSKPENLPGAAYALGFVRSYADYLGLDGLALVERYKEEAKELEREIQLHFPEPLPSRGVPIAALLFIGTILALLFYGAWWYLNNQGKSITDYVPQLSSDTEVVQEETATTEDVASSTDTETTTESVESAVQEATENAEAVVEESVEAVEEATEEVTDAASEAVENVAEEAQETVEEVAEEITATTETALEENTEATTTVVEEVTETAEETTETVVAASEEVVEEVVEEASTRTEAVEEQVSEAVEEVAEEAQETVEEVAEEAAPAAESEATPTTPTVLNAPVEEGKPRIFGEENEGSRVTLKAMESAWVEVAKANGELALTRLLRKGDSYLVPNESGLTMVTGNAGGILVIVDGKEIGPAGPVGAVRREFLLDAESLKNGISE